MSEILKPQNAGFHIFIDNGDSKNPYSGWCDDRINIFVTDLKDPDNDGVRGIDHDEWEDYWENESENSFVTESWESLEDAKEWLLSIGMKEYLV